MGRMEGSHQNRIPCVIAVCSEIAFGILLLRPLKTSFILAPAVVILLGVLLRRADAQNGSESSEDKRFMPWIHAGLISLLLGVIFAAVWMRTKRIVSVRFVDWKQAGLILTIAVAAGLCSVPLVRKILQFFSRSRKKRQEKNGTELSGLSNREEKLSRKDRMLLFLLAAVLVTICSQSSPLYPLNTWVDANCFFTVGKSMLFGKVPYRDLYEQKGPLLYALYALAYPISHRSFLGVWLLEIAAAFAFLFFSSCTIRQIIGRKSPLVLLLSSVLVYTVPAFFKGGSAEELCLPLLMMAICYGTASIMQNRDLSIKEALLIGMSSGAVLWIKYSMLGFYFGFILVPAWRMVREKRFRQLLYLLLSIAAGVALISLPILLYFSLNGAISDLWTAYFYNNIFLYGNSSSLNGVVHNLLSGAASMLTFNDATILLTLFAVISLLREKNYAYAAFIGLCFLFAFLLVYIGGITWIYYSEILCVLIPVGVAQLWKAFSEGIIGDRELEQAEKIRGKHVLGAFTAVLLIAALLGNGNARMLQYRKADLPQFQFAETISETPDATLYNYGALDLGQYTVSDIVPSCRYFCILSIDLEEMYTEASRYISEGATDYIVSRGAMVDSPNYVLVQSALFTDEGVEFPYYLYRRRSVK